MQEMNLFNGWVGERCLMPLHVYDGLIKVDLYIPGCSPHPLTILDGLLRLLGRI